LDDGAGQDDDVAETLGEVSGAHGESNVLAEPDSLELEEEPLPLELLEEEPPPVGLLEEEPPPVGLLEEEPPPVGLLEEEPPPVGLLEELLAPVLLGCGPGPVVLCDGLGLGELEVGDGSGEPGGPVPRGLPGSTGGSGGWCAGRPCRGSGEVGRMGTVTPMAALA